ncbi:hypothetical protein ACHAWO_002974 [Cyclotella atomus]|uniref:DDE Tnp4 domain-containing protein n=1 Tax=Cyclotella atomus TaxID=382360 RepID=A0ABD3NFB1_9STRA
MTPTQFRRYFRMTKQCFELLCERIIDNLGVKEFKSKAYLNEVMRTPSPEHNMMKAHIATIGGYICGEIKLVLAIGNWINNERLVKFNGIEFCSNDEEMQKVAMQFSISSNRILNGYISAIDGWFVKIRQPRVSDSVANPGSFLSHKGFYGINVQCIVDKKKCILYRNILTWGAKHDSTAFKNSKFYNSFLMPSWRELTAKRFYFISNSAYAIKSFLVPPFNDVAHGTAEDNFNFYHILQLKLQWNMHLEGLDIFDEECHRFLAFNPDESVKVQGGELDDRLDADGNRLVGGCPTSDDALALLRGKNSRQQLCNLVARNGYVHPATNWFKNRNGLIACIGD